MSFLALHSLTKIFPGNVCAVDDLSLEVAEGELLVLAGPSGCGKTTTLRMIAGLEPPSGGRIFMAGRLVDHLPPRHRDVAMVFQNGALYPHLSVAANLAFGLKMRSVPHGEITRRVDEAAGMLGIAGLLARRPGELSGGERQRVALGRALVRQPKLFLFDEPLSSLDAGLRADLRHEVRRLHARLGTTMVYVTHDHTEAMTLGQRIAVLRDGRLQQVADPLTLYRRPANRFVAGLIGSPGMNFLEGQIERRDGRLSFMSPPLPGTCEGQAFSPPLPTSLRSVPGEGGGEGVLQLTFPSAILLPIPAARRATLDACVGRPVILGLRSEHLQNLASDLSPDIPTISGIVEAIERLGPESHVCFSAAGRTLIARADGVSELSIAARVTFTVDMVAAHFFDAENDEAIG